MTLFGFSGFFNDEYDADKAQYIENDRLCKLFTKKVEIYKKNMRKDLLAKASLASYEQRAKLFCKKADDLKKEINATTTDTNTSNDTTEQNLSDNI